MRYRRLSQHSFIGGVLLLLGLLSGCSMAPLSTAHQPTTTPLIAPASPETPSAFMSFGPSELNYGVTDVLRPFKVAVVGKKLFFSFGGGLPTWLLPVPGLTFDCNFYIGRCWQQGHGQGTPAQFLANTRSTGELCADNAGNWITFQAFTVAYTNAGLCPFEARTNGIPNSTATGGAAGNSTQLVTNGNFALNPLSGSQNTVLNGWEWTNSSGSGTATWDGVGTVTITPDGTHTVAIDQAFTTVVGHTYTIAATLTGNPAVQVGLSAYASNVFAASAVNGASLYQFVATATTSHLSFAATAASPRTISAVSVVDAGAAPTGWTGTTVSTTGLALTVLSVQTEFGLKTIKYSLTGTATGTSSVAIIPQNPSDIAALYGQTWMGSVFLRLDSGSFPHGIKIETDALTGVGGAGFGDGSPSSLLSVTSTFTRFQQAHTNTTSATTFGRFQAAVIPITSGDVVSVNFTVSQPQLENNSLINSSVASAVVTAGGTGGTNGTNVNLTVTGGTCATAPVIQGTIAGNALTAITGDGTPGSCTVFPPSPATVTGNSLSGATVTLTPTNNAALALATPPIPTTSGAVTRNADAVTAINFPACAGDPWLYESGLPTAPAGYTTSQYLAQIDGGSSSNRLSLLRTSSAGYPEIVIESNGSSATNTGAVWAQNTPGKFINSQTPTGASGSFNGGSVFSAVSSAPIPPLTTLRIGQSASGQLANAQLARIAMGCTPTGLTASQLQTITSGSLP